MGPATTSLRRSQDLARAVREPPVRTQRQEQKLSQRQKPYNAGQWACRSAGRNSDTHRRIHIQVKTDKYSDVRHAASTKRTG
jgi:hypothetical protein